MKIRNVDFDFDILRAADAERFEQAANAMQDTAARLPPGHPGKGPAAAGGRG